MALSLRLERREVEKRIYGVEVSAAHGFRLSFYGYIIRDIFEWRLTKLQIKFDKFVNSHARGKLRVTLKRSPSTRMSISPF